MTAPISESWTRIENWLAEHAPATYAALAPPADPVDISATERVIGRPLLKPLVALLLRHDGFLDQRFLLLPGFYTPMSACEIANEWRLLSYYDQRLEDPDEDLVTIGSSSVLYGHPQMVPFARDVTGGGLVIDHRPERDRGRVHEADPTEGIMRGSHEMWTSLPMLMGAVANSLETGQPLDGYAPAVDEERRLSWDYRPSAR